MALGLHCLVIMCTLFEPQPKIHDIVVIALYVFDVFSTHYICMSVLWLLAVDEAYGIAFIVMKNIVTSLNCHTFNDIVYYINMHSELII